MSLCFFSGHGGENARRMRVGACYRFVLIPFHFIIQFVPGYLCLYVCNSQGGALIVFDSFGSWLLYNVFPQEGAIFSLVISLYCLWFFGYPSEGASIQFDMSFL